MTGSRTEDARPPLGGAGEPRTIYAVGDIHGRYDLLCRLHDMIAADARAGANRGGVSEQPLVVYLGDYVDRGFQSFEVVDLLANATLEGFAAIHLKGNHEQMMLDFLAGRDESLWLFNGGIQTLASYGIDVPYSFVHGDDLDLLRLSLFQALPDSHLRFLTSLQLCHSEGGHLFVHAGVRPGVPLDAQDPRDLLWIRHPFLNFEGTLDQRVVHGHSISRAPEFRQHRIGIDTGAVHTGHLSCLVVDRGSYRMLST